MQADEKLNNKKNKIYAVLTGDIVGSSRLPPEEFKTVMQILRDGAVNFEKSFPGSVFGRLDVFSGDSWQLLVNDYKISLRTALYMRALIKGYDKYRVDTRIAIAWSRADKKTFNPKRISESMGEIFTASGRALSQMDKKCNMVLTDKRGAGITMCVGALWLLDEIVKRWTCVKAQTVALSLLNYNQEEIACKLKKKQATANQALKSAGWRGIKNFLLDVEKRPKAL